MLLKNLICQPVYGLLQRRPYFQENLVKLVTFVFRMESEKLMTEFHYVILDYYRNNACFRNKRKTGERIR